jgi:hypothetical protein
MSAIVYKVKVWSGLYSGIILLLLLVISSTAKAEMFVPAQRPIPPTLFGLHIHRLASTTSWPSVDFNAWSLIDAYVNWRDIQPSPGSWNFKYLDQYVFQAEKHHVELLFPLAFTPQWASARPYEPGPYGPGTAAEPVGRAEWTTYVKTVGERYQGRINYFMVWDEPNEKGFFSGSRDKLFELAASACQTLKEVNPGSRMVSSGFVGPSSYDWLDNFLAAGGSACADIIGFHFYPPIGVQDKTTQRPESMIPAAARVKKIMAKYGLSAKPLWNTGVGYWNLNSDGTPESMAGVDGRWIRLNQDQAAAWVSRVYILGWALGMERVFWYSWDHINMGLIEPTTKVLKPAGVAYQTTCKWLVGSTMTYCRNDGDPQWVCELKRGDRTAWIVWRTSGNEKTSMPSAWNAKEFQTLSGGSSKLESATQPIMIGEQPVLIKGDAKPW